jgi:hypothetical protein
VGESSWITQTLTVPSSLSNATLSFMARLEDGATGSSTLDIELDGTPLSAPQPVSSDNWTHIWYSVDDALGQVVTLTLTVSDNPAILLDEVSLGTATVGGGSVFLPLISK